MKNQIYLVKETTMTGRDFLSIKVYPFLDENEGVEFIKNQAKEYSKKSDLDFIEDGFESVIDYKVETKKILYGVDIMQIDGDNVPDEIFVYTEVNVCNSGEICSHAVGCLTKEESINEMLSEVNNRLDEESDNIYWISDGSISDEYVVLEDENCNESFLSCSLINLGFNKSKNY